MKHIALKDYEGGLTTKAILKTVLNQNPRGMMIDEIRRRCKIMDVVDEGNGHVLLKEDDFSFLSDCLKQFPFSVANKGLLLCIDDVLASDEPPAS